MTGACVVHSWRTGSLKPLYVSVSFTCFAVPLMPSPVTTVTRPSAASCRVSVTLPVSVLATFAVTLLRELAAS